MKVAENSLLHIFARQRIRSLKPLCNNAVTGGLLKLLPDEHFLRLQRRNFLQQFLHVMTCIQIGVHIRMPSAIGMQHQHARSGMGLFDHVGQMVTIITA